MDKVNRELKTIVKAKTIRGTSFVGIRGYQNKNNEISNQVILAGADYEKAKAKDLEFAKDFHVSGYPSKFTLAQRIAAKEEIIKSLQSPRKAQSEGQKAAYQHIAPGLKIHKNKNELYVFGFVLSKEVLVKGVYDQSSSSEATLCKKEMKKAMDLRTSKYRSFSLGSASIIKIEGASI